MNAGSVAEQGSDKPDYGWDAPYAARNLMIAAALCFLTGFLLPEKLHIGSVVFLLKPMFFVTGSLCVVQVLLFLHYVKRGKFRHRDFILRQHAWCGDERVLDVGCGRGLLLVGAAKHTPQGLSTGLDIWSKEDLSGNSEAATLHNLVLEGVQQRCRLISAPAQEMPFAEASFDIVVSNLCLHNLYDRPTRQRALAEIARVLRPGGQALLSDYKLTDEYEEQLRGLGFTTRRPWGSFVDCYPPMRVLVASKPME